MDRGRKWPREMGQGEWSPPCFGFAPACGGLNARHRPEWVAFVFVAGFFALLLVWRFVGVRGEALVERGSESVWRNLIQACRRLVIGTNGH